FIRPPRLDHVSAYCAGWSGDVVAATSFTATALIGTAPPLEAQAIASPGARLRKKSVLRMDTSSGGPRRQRRRSPSLPDVAVMAAPDGMVCAVAVNNEVAGIHPRSRATNGRAFEAQQSPIPVPAAPELLASS